MARLSVGIALSGGTAKTVAHVGVLKALTEAGIRISHISGTSGGGIVGAMFAAGLSMPAMESVATTVSWRKLASIKLSRLGFISSAPIESFMRDAIGDVSFEDLEVPCVVVAANLVTGEKRAFRSGNVARAVRASCSIPQIYLPVEIDGEYYVDGGLVEFLPVQSLAALGCRFIIASHVGPVKSTYQRPHHILQLVMQVTSLMARNNYLRSLELADFVIHPNLDRFNAFNLRSAERMVELGYNSTMERMDDLKSELKRKSRFWHRLIREPGP